MTSNDNDVDVPRSTKNLFTLVSGSLNLKSHQFIATELERNINQLINGLLYYKSHNPTEDSLDQLKKSELNESFPVEVLAKTSLFLNLSSIQCKELFHSYLIYEFKGTPEMVKILFTNDIRVKQLLCDLSQYYSNERLFGLFCMKQILSHWKQSSDHVYKQIFHSFLEKINENNELLPKLINQLIKLNESRVPSRLTNGPYYTESLAQIWIHNNLKEQIEVLQLLLLYLKDFETSIDTIIELLNIFRSNGFGFKYSHLSRNDCHLIDEEIFKFIGFLQSMIIVESLDLKWIYECQQRDIDCQLFKKENVKQLKELEKIIINLSSGVVEHSPIFLSWMLVRNLGEIPDYDSNSRSSITCQLGPNAVELNIFSYLEKSLFLPQTIALNGTVVSDLIYRGIGDLLFAVFNFFNIEMLSHSMTSINQLCVQLFQNDIIATDLFKNGLDSGLGIIISVGLNNFPFKMNPILSFCLSLSKTENCRQLFEKLSILSNLTSYCEPFDTSLTNYGPTEEDSTYVLINDKMLFRDMDLFIEKETKGLLKVVNNTRVIEWVDINIDGWKLIYYRYKEYYEMINKGQLYSVPEIALIEMSQITEICSNLIKHNCYQHISSFNRIITLCFETYDLFSSIENPFRIFMSSILELTASVISLDLVDATTLWNRITGKRFMPYMIGLTSDLNQMMSGNDTNTSVLGRIIASEECVKGNYELCLSFLNLIEKVVQKSKLKENSDLMASLIFIIQEIFPSHFLWNFKNQNQFYKIGRICFDIFHQILSNTEKTNPTKIEKIVINSLMEGKAAQTLLKVIKSGEINVRNVILSAGNDNSLINDDQIIIVRHSLSTLNRLLELHTPSNPSEAGVVASALFSSQSKPNMLLIVAHYVYQRYDTLLSSLAVQLLTELAKRFPMSMLACLGSDAETMREHFLYRLEEVTEDLNLKIALLNFLSACAEKQPGLMEMFLNVDIQINESTTGCLQTVLEILKEKREAKYYCPFDLHLASLKFLYTFWVGPHLLAIDSLKKTSDFWALITFPLLEESTFDDILCVYILRILAREVFYIKSLERDKFDSDLENIFKTLKESNKLTKLSKHISILLSNDSVSEDLLQLLNAWKDFLVSIIKFNPFDITNDMRADINSDIIDSLLVQITRNQMNNKVMAILSNILLIISVNWENTAINSEQLWYTSVEKLLKNTEEKKEVLPFGVLFSMQTSIIQYLKIATKDFDSCDWIVSSSKLLNQSLRIIEKQIKESQNSSEIEFRLSVTSISLLQTLIIGNSSRSSIWIPILRKHFVIESVTNLLGYLNEKRIGIELSLHIMSFLVELSSIQCSAETLFLIGFIDNLCISLQNTYTMSASTAILKSKLISILNWVQVFHLSIRLIINLIKHLKHHFVETAITFVAIHLDHMIDVLTKLRTNPKNEEIKESLLIATLCHSLSDYHQIWKKSHPFSFKRIQDEILKTSNSLIAFLIRPNYLSYIMDNSEAPKTLIPKEMTPKKFFPTNAFESKSLRKSISWEPDLSIHSIESTVLDSFFTFQAFSLAFLQNISPNIYQLMERQGLGNEWNIIINTSFSSPDIDPNLNLSFGSLINCIHLCIKTLSRSEKSSDSQSFKPNQQIRDLLILIFEISLSFMVSQTIVAQMSSAVSDVDKQIIVREIKSELTTIISNASPRQSKRLSQSSHISTPRSLSTTSSLIERSFVKFLLQFVDKISQ